MYSHHSHSGDYVAHALDTLETIIARAVELHFKVFCLTEHMPRLTSNYLYPEEVERGYGVKQLQDNFERYVKHAKRLQAANISETKLLIGFETEGIDQEHIEQAKRLLEQYKSVVNMTIGSVHYVHGIPIDFSPELWQEARHKSGSVRELFKDYFNLQYTVLSELKPEVVGHFDLIRLFLPNEIDPHTEKLLSDVNLKTDWPDVWELIERNVRYVNSYGGLFELNSAAIRKGWDSPYPKKDIASFISSSGGKFCLSDDSHSIAQVATNYDKAWTYIKDVLELKHIYHLDIKDGRTVIVEDSVADLDNDDFWKQF